MPLESTKELSNSVKEAFFTFKSAHVYNMWIERYNNWKKSSPESVDFIDSALTVLEFLQYLSNSYAPNTLWSVYSILNKYLKIYHNVDISKAVLIYDYLKSINKSYLPKKSAVFTREDLRLYFQSAPETDESILTKCLLAIGVSGLLRVSELVQLTVSDITSQEEKVRVFIRGSKTDQACRGWYFYVSGAFRRYVDDYRSLLPENHSGRFFLKIQNGKSTKRVVGKNWIAKVPFKIATALGLEEPQSFTGHAFRRSGASIMADDGVDKMVLKRAGRWKSDTVADGYVAESKVSKAKISEVICGKETRASDSGNADSGNAAITNVVYNISGCSGFVANFSL